MKKNESFFKDNFRSFYANYVLLVLILAFNSLKVSSGCHNIGVTFERFSHKLVKTEEKCKFFCNVIQVFWC